MYHLPPCGTRRLERWRPHCYAEKSPPPFVPGRFAYNLRQFFREDFRAGRGRCLGQEKIFLAAALLQQSAPKVQDFSEDYKNYLNVARSALGSTREVIRRARAAGFTEFTKPEQVKPGARLLIPNRDRSLILAVVGTDPIVDGSRVVGTHQDSPHIELKARPIYPAGGFALFKTKYYGGIKKYQWSNLPLALVGRIDTTDGRTVDISIGLNPGEPVFVIPDAAPHSDTELRSRTYTNVLQGEELDPVIGSIPGEKSSVAVEVTQLLMSTYKIKEEDLVSAELSLVPAAHPEDVGFDRGLIGAYGQDDRVSSFCAARSIIDLKGHAEIHGACLSFQLRGSRLGE